MPTIREQVSQSPSSGALIRTPDFTADRPAVLPGSQSPSSGALHAALIGTELVYLFLVCRNRLRAAHSFGHCYSRETGEYKGQSRNRLRAAHSFGLFGFALA